MQPSIKTENRVNCIILGGGGHAHVVIDSLKMSGLCMSYAILDPDQSLWGLDVLGVPVAGGDALLPDLVDQGANWFVVGLGSIGNNKPRQRLYELGLSHKLRPLTVIHPTAVPSQWAKVGLGGQLLPRSIVNAGATLGVNVVVNSGAIVEHHCVLGDHVHVATGAQLASNVHVGTGAHVGAGATVKQEIDIGAWAIVGAGAVVVKDVPPNTVVAGVPARPLR